MRLSSPIAHRLCSVLLGFLATSLVEAEEKVLFIGNSFTFGHGGTASVPEIFDRLAIAGGEENPLVEMSAVGGKDFGFHENYPPTQYAIESQPWTHVVIQNYSTAPTHLGDMETHLRDGNLLYERIKLSHPEAAVLLYQTWARSAKHPLISGKTMPDSFASTTEMQDELREGYQKLADFLNQEHAEDLPVLIAPAGDAWMNAGGMVAASNPNFVHLFDVDDYHGNDNGYFISAAVFYATIYGKNPAGLHLKPAVMELGLKLSVDPEWLERVAWETVTGTMKVGILTQPQSQTVGVGQAAEFSVAWRGSQPVTFQWMENGKPIPGANRSNYVIERAGKENDGEKISVVVSNRNSSATSDEVNLKVTPVPENSGGIEISDSECPAADRPHDEGNEE